MLSINLLRDAIVGEKLMPLNLIWKGTPKFKEHKLVDILCWPK